MVEVVQSKVEELKLEAQVDVLVSEPMGTLLVNERMLETYLYARDRYLKKGGRMFPVSKVPCTLRWPLRLPSLCDSCNKALHHRCCIPLCVVNCCTVRRGLRCQDAEAHKLR